MQKTENKNIDIPSRLGEIRKLVVGEKLDMSLEEALFVREAINMRRALDAAAKPGSPENALGQYEYHIGDGKATVKRTS
jgi:hypothetical protein